MKKEKVTVQETITLSNPADNRTLWAIAIVGLFALFAVYWNHFDNAFHFDDSHTITDNVYIRDVKQHYKKYFTDATTFTPLPANQTYRPLVTLSLATDYWVSYQLGKDLGDKLIELEKAGKTNTPEYKALVDEAMASKYITRANDQPKPFVFHISNFFWYLVLGVLLYFFLARLFQLVIPGRYTRFFALFGTLWYMFHTVNAETINYIISRSDSYSTLFILLAFVTYQYSAVARRFFLYLIPMVLAVLVKATAVMFAPMLIVYILFIEEQIGVFDLLKTEAWKKILTIKVIAASAMSMVIAALGYFLIIKMSPATFMPSMIPKDKYLITEVYVYWLYFKEFFLPTHLTADTDLTAFESIADQRFFIGIAFMLALFVSIVITSNKRQLRPIAFGLSWFFLALLPTSSFQPLSEVMNDHRMFFPNIGLIIAVVWGVYLLFRSKEFTTFSTRTAKVALSCAAVLFISAYAFGTYQRNQVWDNDEDLWFDVTEKSPKNGRGLMNYALTQYNKSFEYTAKGDKQGAVKYLNRAIEYYTKGLKYNPYYSYLHINIALAYDALGMAENAPNKYVKITDDHFKKGQQYAGGFYGAYYFYSNWLWKQGRKAEAIWNAEQAVNLGPDYEATYTTLMGYYMAEYEWDKMKITAQRMLQRFPGNQYGNYYLQASQNRKSKVDELLDMIKANPTPENYLNLSLEYYNKSRFEDCILAAENALKVKPDYAEAYNNICSAYNALGNYDKAMAACNMALKIAPGYTLAQGNLNYSLSQKKNDADLAAKPTAEGYLTKGLNYHTQKQYTKAIDMYNKSLEVNPNYALAYNNLCSAYNDLGQFSKAIPFGEKAVKLEPTNQLFKNNLEVAKKGR
ncbi:MAG: tetratricopeptide repeat protein [Sphingobacteriales bacterium JAD_PAG50586_3]|nr:MAG: tetratricopeptide repeat protein [Sphingobacteriales bacterium JAD_PAG50586_3]